MNATTAKYIRLSSEDDDLKSSGKAESNSVTNQRNLLDAFISRTPELADTNVIEFCDDGWSGKNFERPAVQEMLAQVREGKIQCIVVKDLSRFGRNYLEVGNYISYVFPFLDVRFIAVNDGFDSIRPTDIDSLETSFKNLLYDLYSRDLSRKVRNAQKFRAQRGDFLSPFAPYGYIKDPADKNRLVIDPEAAETVRRIFRLAAEGKETKQISIMLNRDAVPTPMLYKRAAGCSRTWPSIWEDNFWTDNMVTKILRDERYIGKNIFGKRMRDIVGSTHSVKVRRADWIAVENTHEGIVTREEFDRAQTAMRALTERDEIKKHDVPLHGKVRCGVCGHAMEYTNGKKKYLYCRTPRFNSAYTCCADRTPVINILETVSEGLYVRALIAVELRRLWEEQHRGKEKDTAATRKTLLELREKHGQLCQQVKGLYESFALGEIGKPEYLAAKAAAVQQRDAAAVRIAELEAVLENTGSNGGLQNGFVSTFGKYMEVEEITSEIVTEVLNEVRIYSGGRLEIIWNLQDELEKLVLTLQGDHQNGT